MKSKDLNRTIKSLSNMKKVLLIIPLIILLLPIVHAEFISSYDQYATERSICKMTTVKYIDDSLVLSTNDNQLDLSWWQKSKNAVSNAIFPFKTLGATGKYNIGYQMTTPDLAGWNTAHSTQITRIQFTIDSLHFNWADFFDPTVASPNYTKTYEIYNISTSDVTKTYLFYPTHAWFEHNDVAIFSYCIYFDGPVTIDMYNETFIMPFGSGHKITYTSFDGGDSCSYTDYSDLVEELNTTSGFIGSVEEYSGIVLEFLELVTELWFIIYWLLSIGIIIGIAYGLLWLIFYVYRLVRLMLS